VGFRWLFILACVNGFCGSQTIELPFPDKLLQEAISSKTIIRILLLTAIAVSLAFMPSAHGTSIQICPSNQVVSSGSPATVSALSDQSIQTPTIYWGDGTSGSMAFSYACGVSSNCYCWNSSHIFSSSQNIQYFNGHVVTCTWTGVCTNQYFIVTVAPPSYSGGIGGGHAPRPV
jgi:hypothetical protein